MRKLSLPIFGLLLIIGLAGLGLSCRKESAPNTSLKQQAINDCQESCRQAKVEVRDLSVGPCLSEEIALDWVCDVAHSPRQSIDNEPINQCAAFREGRARYFVEVDSDCGLIRTGGR